VYIPGPERPKAAELCYSELEWLAIKLITLFLAEKFMQK
jgi:hypothetical protein